MRKKRNIARRIFLRAMFFHPSVSTLDFLDIRGTIEL